MYLLPARKDEVNEMQTGGTRLSTALVSHAGQDSKYIGYHDLFKIQSTAKLNSSRQTAKAEREWSRK
jgi:hypothetical protein